MSPFRLTLSILACGLAASLARGDDLSAEQLSFFESKIRPVLIAECYGCHSDQAGNVRGGLRLDTQARMQVGGSSGPAIAPGDPEGSLLFTAMLHEDFEMPPKRKLPQNVLDDFRKWIEMGAPDPRASEVGEIQSSISPQDIESARNTFWAYQPPQDNGPPAVQDTSWPESPIDQFVLAKLEANALTPAADAEPHKVLRRLCYDLVGLPPTPEQIQHFENRWRESPQQAVEMAVDRLLDSQQYGQRWGRHWLDVARYAESTGREVNMTYPHAWRYRDYVIDSFNIDKPFDRFIQEQLAGDLLPADSDEQWAENLVATTFLAMGPKNVNEQNRVQFDADLVDEQIDATTRVFLGMSVSCARCHDHKFDAIPQSDYYAMAGVFGNLTTYFGNPPSEFGAFSTPQRRRSSSLILLPIDDPNPFDASYDQVELSELKRQITDTMASAAQARRERVSGGGNPAQAQRMAIATANKLAELSDQLSVVDSNGQPRSYCMGVQERDPPRDMPLLVRGEIDLQGETIPRGFPQVLCSEPIQIAATESGRLQLAKWIGSSDNTLAARVMANRVWQHLAGQGIVTSTENFGTTGSHPSHPELLDYLAVRFVASGWSIKSLVREIATSRFYRMDSAMDIAKHETDPDNALLWRANPRRQDAEAMRDAMLSISGQIDLERPRGSEVAKAGYMRVRDGVLTDPRETIRKAFESAIEQQRFAFGQGVSQRFRSPRPSSGRGPGASTDRQRDYPQRFGGMGTQANTRESLLAEAARTASTQLDMEQAVFRSVFLPIVRDEIPRSLEVFDFADANTVVGTRESSHTPNQALYLLNNRFVIAQSDAFAARLRREHRLPREQIAAAFELTYGRGPTSRERAAAEAFVKSYSLSRDRDSTAANLSLSALCQSLFASAEFQFID